MKSAILLCGALGFALLTPLAAPVLAAPAPTYTSKKDGYAIYLPGQPKSVSRQMAASGIGRKKVDFISLTRGPLTYVVIPMLLPAAPTGANLDGFLNGVQRGFTASPAAKLLSSNKISLPGAPGREILVQVGQNLLRGRFFVKGKRSYQVVAIVPRSGAAKYGAQVAQVLNSFRILN